MEKRLIHVYQSFPADHQSAEVAYPGKRPFRFPATSIASQLAAILKRPFSSIASVRANQVDLPSLQTPSQRIGIRRLVVNQPPYLAFPIRRIQYGFDQIHFGRRCRGNEASQRNTFAVDHHHPLRTLAALGFSNTGAPFLAGAKLPSEKVSSQSSKALRSISLSSPRHALSHAPTLSQYCKRRQQVLGDGKCGGKSFQRAPLRSTHKIPSKQRRLSIGLGPPQPRGIGGRYRSIFAHWASVNSDWKRCINPAPHQPAPLKQYAIRSYETASTHSERKGPHTRSLPLLPLPLLRSPSLYF